MTKRATKKDWLDAGLELLNLAGASTLTIDRLCSALSKTKGSFYHHFGDMDTYIGELLQHWRYLQTQQAIDHANTASTPAERMALLNQTVLKLDHHLDMVIRHWAQQDARAKHAVEEVDAQRLAYLSSLYLEMGLTQTQSTSLAEMEYSAFVGSQCRFINLTGEQARQVAVTTHNAIYALINQWQAPD